MLQLLRLVSLTIFSFALLFLQPLAAAEYGKSVRLDPNLPIYHPLAINQVKGELKLGGSNTLSHVAASWIRSFQKIYPEAKITVEVNGSRAAVENVKSGKTQIGLLSRRVREDEIAQFQKKFGYSPTVLTPCLERTAIFVHRDNPIQGLTLAQLDSIFSNECKRGAEKSCGYWGGMGLEGEWRETKIIANGRTKDTGSQVFMEEAVLLGADMRDDLVTHQSNVDMIRKIAETPGAIGFAGLSYATPEVRAVPLAIADGHPFVSIDSPEADRGHYPLVRRLQLVVKHDRKQDLPLIEREFIKYVFSKQGQEDVVKAGFQAIPSRPARIALDAVGLGLAR